MFEKCLAVILIELLPPLIPLYGFSAASQKNGMSTAINSQL
jgi:hypothetical protein